MDAHASVERSDAVTLELAVTQGPHKGEVVVVVATHMGLDAIAVLGLPATLHVEDGAPRVELS